MDLYAENILDHYRNPRNKRGPAAPSPTGGGPGRGATVSHTEENISCGDKLIVCCTIEDERIAALSWDGIGCAISLAGMSMLSEEIEGVSADAVLAFEQKDIYDLLGVPIGPRRFKCALIGLHTVKNALRKAKGLEPRSWLDSVEL